MSPSDTSYCLRSTPSAMKPCGEQPAPPGLYSAKSALQTPWWSRARSVGRAVLKGTNAKVWGSSTQGNTTGPVGKCGRSQAGIWSVLLDFLPHPFQSSRQPPLLYFQDVFIS